MKTPVHPFPVARFASIAALALGACGGGESYPANEAVALSEAGAAIVIEGDPQPLLVREGESAMFNVTAVAPDAGAAAPLHYQWRRDGIDIPGANQAWLQLASASMADDGARYSVIVGDDAGDAVASTSAVLAVVGSATELPWR